MWVCKPRATEPRRRKYTNAAGFIRFGWPSLLPQRKCLTLAVLDHVIDDTLILIAVLFCRWPLRCIQVSTLHNGPAIHPEEDHSTSRHHMLGPVKVLSKSTCQAAGGAPNGRGLVRGGLLGRLGQLGAAPAGMRHGGLGYSLFGWGVGAACQQQCRPAPGGQRWSMGSVLQVSSGAPQ